MYGICKNSRPAPSSTRSRVFITPAISSKSWTASSPSTGNGDPFSLVFLDLDNFKAVVDTYGHLRGAEVLSEVARVINGELGPDDSLVRYGGDEFIILLPRRSQPEVLEITRRLRYALNHTAFLQNEGLRIKVTASYGIATLPEDAQDRKTLLFIADRALFGSKGRGRDRIMLARDLVAEPEDCPGPGQPA